jgi:uncharacterized protein YggE
MSRQSSINIGTIAAIVLAALVIAVAGVLWARPVAAQDVGVTGMRQITVIGQGEATGKPDTMSIQVGVTSDATDVSEALRINNEQAAQLHAKLKELGIADADIQTSNFNVYPRYNNDGTSVTGYQVSNTVTIIVRDLAASGDILNQVVAAGANQIHGINFSVADPQEQVAQAREKAIADARVRAEQYAKASGASVGEVLVISENVGGQSVMPVAYAARMDSASVPVQAGELSFTASVQVTFALK